MGKALAFHLVLMGLLPALRADEPPRPELDRLKSHVDRLAAPDFEGRRGAGARKAEVYVTEHFRALGLKPGFGNRFTQDIAGKEPGQVLGRNVAARLDGADPALRDEWVILSAHYDHLGVRNGQTYPGADDNASGVAMLLEVARSLADAPEKPRRSVLFVSFDLEEDGLWGSRFFVEEPPVPLDRVKLFLTADLIAGALGGVCASQVFIMGTEHAPGLRPWVAAAGKDRPVRMAVVGSDLLLFDRSDYGPFRARKVPYLFFSTGETPRYHTPRDTPDTLDYQKLEAVSRIMGDVVVRAAQADKVPAWSPTADNPLAEAVALREVIQVLLDHRDALKIKGAQVSLMTTTLEQLEGIIARGVFTAAERSRVLRVAQLILYSVL